MNAPDRRFCGSPHQELSREEALALTDAGSLVGLMAAAAARRDMAHGQIVSYSPKVFIPLTKLCRDVCHYCTFAHPPRKGERAFATIEEMLAIAEAGKAAGCTEALFTLGDKPEARYRVAREELAALGHETTLAYLAEAARAVLERTGLLPHLNPGVMSAPDIAMLRDVSVSQGIMLESISDRLCEKGGPHYGSPDKRPDVRLATIEAAGEMAVPFTSGLLIGIGETRQERVEALLALRDLHARYGHIHEIIIQNFRPKPGTKMTHAPAAALDEQLWTIAVARLIFPPEMNIQAPPNLQPGALAQLISAGINDWGGVSPVTPDHVNPEAPWPHLQALADQTAASGKQLVPRLPIYPDYIRELERWAAPAVRTRVLQSIDADGWGRTDGWSAGAPGPLPQDEVNLVHQSKRRLQPEFGKIDANQKASAQPRERSECVSALVAQPQRTRSALAPILSKAAKGAALSESDIVELFRARGSDFSAVCAAADALRRDAVGDAATYVVTRNINYTNICGYRCQFCAFSKGKTAEHLRGRPYNLRLDEIADHARDAWARGATEVCMQGGIHPDYTGQTYLDILHAVKAAVPGIHVHAFSPLEVHHGAATLGLSLPEFLGMLKDAGLGSLPGTAAEILDDEVRAVLCADKIGTQRWLEVMRAAHGVGLRSTATIMFGHVDRYEHWARHLLRLRALQAETGGFTELVPLAFVHMEAPIYLKGRARRGPSFREAVLMHAVARLALHRLIDNVQASWVKMGPDGMGLCLEAGANDMGGTLMYESITRSAGASHGQEMTPERLRAIAEAHGRTPRQRTTLYAPADRDRTRDAVSRSTCV
jgi:FO synthase